MAQLFSGLRRKNIPISPLFSAPGFTLAMVVIDVLHAMDLGITQDILGNLFFAYMNSSLCTGSNKATRLSELWNRIKAYYRDKKPPTKINKLTYEMVKLNKKGPRFRGKGAETRHLVLFGYELASYMAEQQPNVFHTTLGR